MTQVELRQTPTAVAKATLSFAQRAQNIQAEAAESIVRANRHWIEQCHTEWMETRDLIRRFSSTDTTVEKVGAVQTWLSGATERGMRDASYAIEVARALGSIELKLFAKDVETPKAA